MGNSLVGCKKTTKIMNVDGKTTKLKIPIQAMEITKDHPGHVLLDSEAVKHFGVRAKPLDPAQYLEPKKVYFLVELPKFPLDHHREPRRVWSGTIQMSAKERLESLMLKRRSVSDLSIMKPAGSVVVEEAEAETEAEEGASGKAVRVRMRMPKAEVERVIRQSKDKAEAAEKIMDLYMGKPGSGSEQAGSPCLKAKEAAAFGSPGHHQQPQLRRQARREKSPLGRGGDGYKKRVGFVEVAVAS